MSTRVDKGSAEAEPLSPALPSVNPIHLICEYPVRHDAPLAPEPPRKMNVRGARSEGARFHLFVNSASIDPRDRARGCSNDRACGSVIVASAPRDTPPPFPASPLTPTPTDPLFPRQQPTITGLFTAFVKVNGQLRRWYEPLAPPNVISDHIPDLAGAFHATHPGGPRGDPDSPIDVDTHHALVALVIFAVAFVFNMNAALWSAQNNRCRLNLQVAYISAVAAWTHWEMYRGQDWYVAVPNAGARGQTVSFSCLRQLEWVFTTPILLLLVQNLHAYALSSLPDQQLIEAGGFAAKNPKMSSGNGSTYTPANRLRLVLADEAMILAGLVSSFFIFICAIRLTSCFVYSSCQSSRLAPREGRCC